MKIIVTDATTGATATFPNAIEAYKQASYLLSLGHNVEFKKGE